MMWKEIEIDKKYLINEKGTIKRIEFLDKRGYRFPEITLSVHISQGYPTVTINGIEGNLINIFGSSSFAAKSQGYHPYTIDWAIKTKAGYYKGNIYSYASL